jgi:hypothetical protein
LTTVWVWPKIQQTKTLSRYKNLALSSKQSQCTYEGRLKVILQLSSHDFEPIFIIFCLN